MKSKLLVAGVVALAIFSVVGKFILRHHDVHYFYNTNSLQHFYLALDLLPSYTSKNIDDRQKYDDFIDESPSTKYPLLLTKNYLYVAKALNTNFEFLDKDLGYIDFMASESTFRFISAGRIVHLGYFVLILITMLFIPVSWPIRFIAIGLVSTSLICHLYFTTLRIHSPVGFFLLLTVVLGWRLITSNRFLTYSAACGLSSGLAASTFFTGGIALFVGLGALLMRRKVNADSNWYSTINGLFVMVFFTAITFNYYYPQFSDFLLGRGDLLMQEHFWLYTGADTPAEHMTGRWGERFSGFGLGGFKAYLTDLVGKDPLVGLSYLCGLIVVIRKKLWKQPQWFLILLAIVPYQILMGFLETTDARRIVLIVPLACLVGAQGLVSLYCKVSKKKMYVVSVLLLFVFSTATISRYNYVTLNDTRQQIIEYVNKEIPPGKVALIDHRLPTFKSKLIKENRHLESGFIVLDELWHYLKNNIENHPEMKSNLVKEFGDSFLKGKPNVAVIDRLWPLNYYIENLAMANTGHANLVRRAFPEIDPLVIFQPLKNGELPIEKMGWPSREPYILWDLWKQDSVGPEIRVYKLHE